MDPVRIVEAALFSASRPLRAVEIATNTGLTLQAVRKALKILIKEYDERGSAIEIGKVGSAYDMRLREEFQTHAMPFAEREVPEDALKTAALVAYHQPVLQSELVKMLGTGVYDHVRTLRSMGLIRAQKAGHTLKLTTTRRFCEYFGIESTRREDIKRWIESRAGREGGISTEQDDRKDQGRQEKRPECESDYG